jgi:hypothetical protein
MDWRVVGGAVVVIAIIGFFLMTNKNSPSQVSEEPKAGEAVTPVAGSPEAQEGVGETEGGSEEEKPEEATGSTELPCIPRQEEVEGNCVLMYSKLKKRYDCFGCAGDKCTEPSNDWVLVESDRYLCKATEYGCRLYEPVQSQYRICD